ncbi:unnamed protein product, partial [Ectocarpus sp. 12 AP-2014]
MFRTVLATIAPRATAASRSRAASGRCAPFTAFATRRPSPSSPPQRGQSLPLDCAAPVTIRSVSRRCSWREMSSASAHVAAPGGDDLAMQ